VNADQVLDSPAESLAIADEHFRAGRYNEALAALNLALKQAVALPDSATALAILDKLALIEGIIGNGEEAFRHVKMAAAIASKSSRESDLVTVDIRRIHLQWKFGSLVDVIERINALLSSKRIASDAEIRSYLGRMLGHAYVSLREYSFARMAWATALDTSRARKDGIGEAHALLGLAVSLIEETWNEQFERALSTRSNTITLTPAALAALDRVEQLLDQATLLANGQEGFERVIAVERGRAAALLDKRDDAEKTFQTFFHWSRQANDRWNFMVLRMQYAMYCLMTDRIEEASLALRDVIDFKGSGDLNLLLMLDIAKTAAAVAERLGQLDVALQQMRRYAELLTLWGKQHAAPVPRPYFVIKQHRVDQRLEVTTNVAHQLDRAEQYIRRRLAEDFQVAELAEYLSISKRQLQRLYTDNLHISPRQFIINLRLEAAHALLLHPAERSSIARIAEQTGFTRLATFSRAYSAKYGERPSDTMRRG
jgi:AraC-like DNA-binding protein/tetratricopeptide (TPR) repeat protein